MSIRVARAFLSAILIVGLTACGSDGISGGTVAAVNTGFPGGPASAHLLATDGGAFNDLSAIINKGIQVHWNRANGQAIVLYTDQQERLFAHYWNGATFTPAVELKGLGQRISTGARNDPYVDQDVSLASLDDGFGGFERVRVCFLNTTGHANANAQARNGDAVIAWVRKDNEPPAGFSANEDSNDRLYASYFDVSAVGTPVAGTVRHGFQTLVPPIDFDNQRDGLGNDDYVRTFGFVSDSLCGSHGFDERVFTSQEFDQTRYHEVDDTALPPATRSGDPTSHFFFVWIKSQASGAVTTPAERVHQLEFDLTQVGNAIPTQAGLGSGEIVPPVALVAATPVERQLVVHNECLIWAGTTAAGTQTWISCFAPGLAPTTVELSDIGTFGTNTMVPRACDVYGADHGGLLSLYAFFLDDATFLYTAKVDRDVPLAGGVPELALTSSADVFDGTRINRDSDWISCVSSLGGIPSLAAVQTRKAGVRTLANSVATPISPPPNWVNSLYVPPNSPSRIVYQSELACGTDCDPRCGIQSNANRINICWHELNGGGNLELKTNAIEITLSAVAAPPTIAAPFGAATGLVAEHDNDYEPLTDSDGGLLPTLVDLGTPAGDALIYFVKNANNPTDDTAPGAFDEIRPYAVAAVPGFAVGDAAILGTDSGAGVAENAYNGFYNNSFDNSGNDFTERRDVDADDFMNPTGQMFRVVTTPKSLAAGNHGGTLTHVFFTEPRTGARSLPKLSTRVFTKASFNPANVAATFGPAFGPALGSDPFNLDGARNTHANMPFVTYAPNEDNQADRGSRIGCNTAFTTTSGNTVGCYFQSGRHFWYQEFNGAEWFDDGGIGDPALIDQALPNGLFFGIDQNSYAFAPQRAGQCDDLNGVLAFYSKVPAGDDPGSRRYFVRVRN